MYYEISISWMQFGTCYMAALVNYCFLIFTTKDYIISELEGYKKTSI